MKTGPIVQFRGYFSDTSLGHTDSLLMPALAGIKDDEEKSRANVKQVFFIYGLLTFLKEKPILIQILIFERRFIYDTNNRRKG
ncbi:MAG: hypothetical protein ACLQPD_35210 [Desulfomonilaceae bacterium]